MKIVNVVSALALVMAVSSVSAAPIDHVGGFVGGALGGVKFIGDFNSSMATTNRYDIDRFSERENKAGTINAYGGYHFNRYLGIEGSLLISGDLSESTSYDAGYSEIAVTPKLTIPIGERFVFFIKAGLAAASYVEIYDRVPYFADDEFSWGGVGLTAGLGMQVAVMEQLHLRFSFDHTKVALKPSDDIAYDGVSFFSVADIDAKINRSSIGIHYQF